MAMDALDVRMLKLLQENGRITVSQLSQVLLLSRPSVSERLNRLQEQGVIAGFGARVPPAGVGRSMLLFILISQLRVNSNEFEKQIKTQPYILECHRVTGSVSYLLKAAVSGMESLQKLVDQLIPFGTVNTSIVLSSPVPYRPVLPEDAEEK
jgi:Lrp/AsnC family transcriptional regulator, leucine-responsive regulatory protein